MPNYKKLSFKKQPAKKLSSVFTEADKEDLEILQKVKYYQIILFYQQIIIFSNNNKLLKIRF